MKCKSINIALIWIFYLFCIPLSKAEFINFESSKRKIHLNIYLENATEHDTLQISVNNLLGTMFPDLANSGLKKTINKFGYFEFEIPVSNPFGYLQISKFRRTYNKNTSQSYTPIFRPQFWEDGDSITINVNFKENTSGLGSLNFCTFQGSGALKYTIAMKLNFRNFKLNPLIPILTSGKPPVDWDGNILNYNDYDAVSTKQKVMLDTLRRYKISLSEISYNIIKSYILYPSLTFGFEENFLRYAGLDKLDKNHRSQFIKRFTNSYDYPRFYGLSKDALDNSIYIMTYLMNRFKILSYLNTGVYSLDWIYSAIKNDRNISKATKETLIMRFLSMPFRDSNNLLSLYNDANRFITNEEYDFLLKKVSSRLSGNFFFPFNLSDTNGAIRSLPDFKGKIVLIDFWFTGCLACSHYFNNTLSKVERSFKDNSNIVFISICIDKDREVWINSLKKGIYSSDHVINLYTNGQGYHHNMLKEMNITSFPCVILIDKNGVIKDFNTANLYNETSLTTTIHDLLKNK